MAILTMTLGNLSALQQDSVVRLLAYSSVSTGGFILVPFGIVETGASEINSQAFQAVMVYLLVYSVMNLGAFSVVIAVARQKPRKLISDFAGLGQTQPGMAIAPHPVPGRLDGHPTAGRLVRQVRDAGCGGAAGQRRRDRTRCGHRREQRHRGVLLLASGPHDVDGRSGRRRADPQAGYPARGRSSVAWPPRAVILGILPGLFASFAEMSTLVAGG